MHSTCVSSSFSVRYRGASSFSFNDYNYCFNDTFDRNPLLNSSSNSSSQSCSSCCCCCSNSFQSRVPILNPSYYLYGIRQSTLIQWSPSKRLILNGLEPSYGSRFSVCDVNRNYDAKERKACDRKEKLGKGRFRCMGFEEENERRSLCGGFDEAEVILSLLTEDVSEECFSMREKRGKSVRKIDVKGGNGGDNNGRNRKSMKGMEKFEYEVKITKSREEGKSKEDNRRENEREIGSRRNNRGRANKEERDNQRERMREEEREILLRENQRERMREEERERLSRQADHRRKLRKDGSSCSSYYSLASGEFESDDEIQVEQEGFESSSGYRKDSKSREMVSKEVREDFERHGHSKEYQMIKERNQAGFSGASNVVESDWRKTSEKKLTDGSVEKAQYEKESAQNLSTYIEDKKNSKQKDFESYSGFDDRNKMSTLSVNVDERTRDQNRQTSDTGNRMKYKQFTESSDAYGADLETSSTSHKFYGRMDENSSKSTSSVQEAKEQIRKEEKYRGSSSKSAEASKVEELEIRGTSTIDRRSETRMKDQEDHSARIQSSVHDTEEELRHTAQASRIMDSRIKRQQLTTDVNKESTSISHSEAKSSFVYNSHLETTERLQETNLENVSRLEYKKGSQEVTVVDDGDKRKLEIIMASSPSQSGSLLDESRSGLKIQEIVDERLHSESIGTSGLRIEEIGDERLPSGSQKLRETKGDESHGQPSKLLSPEDALGSADRFQKSSAHYVGEFVEKAKNEISSSEIDKVKDTYKAKLFSNDEKENQSILGSNVSGVSESKEQDSRRSSQGSGTKGPSDQMWDVTEPAIEEPPVAEATVAESTAENAVVKSSGKSLWNVIADVVRFRWASRSENRSSPSKSAGKSSPNQSTGSETWFSGHEQEESNDSNVQKNKISLQAPLYIEQQQEENISSSLADGSRSSSSKNVMKHSGVGASTSSVVIRKDSSPKTTLLPSNEAKSTTAVTEGGELSPPLLSSQVGVLAARKAEGSGSDTIVQVDQPVQTLMRNKTSLESKNEELKRRKLQRIDQVQTDRFDEWEEAYMFETEQRKMDEMFMREALMEAKKAADCWEVPVGAVLVHDGKIIARGYNLVEELRDSTAHAEMICIREASNMLRTWRLSQTTLYVTLEPCPMCAGAILQARIDTVVWGAPNKLLGADGSWIRLFPNGDGESGPGPSDKPAAPVHPFHPNIAIRRGILSSECADIMQQFFQLRRKKKETKKQEPTTNPPPSCLPISHHPSKFMTKMHDAFHLMFCL